MNHQPRDLEWQRRYEENDTPWDKGAAAPPLVKFLRGDRISGRVLVPGCGKGHDVRGLTAHPGISAVGLDLSSTAIEEAKRLSAGARDANSSFIVGDLFRLPANLRHAFDWVVEHTCFCALEPGQRGNYVKGVSTALKPGGKLFGIFYIDPDTESGPPFRVSAMELTELFTPYFSLDEKWMPAESFPGREGRELVWIMQKL